MFAVEEEEEGEETNQKIDDEVHVHLFVLLLLYVSFCIMLVLLNAHILSMM